MNICLKFKLNFYAGTELIIMEHFDSGPNFNKGRVVCVFKQESCTFLSEPDHLSLGCTNMLYYTQ